MGEEEQKDRRKEKKAKKSKKKNKKKSKKRKEKESEEEGEREGEQKEETTEHKPLVPYDEGEEPSIDPTKFFNSFSETVVEEVKPKLKLPTLIFNEKTVELAPRAEVEPEPELQVGETKAGNYDVKKSQKTSDSSKTQDMVVESRTIQEEMKEPEISKRNTETRADSQKDFLLGGEVEAAAPSKWDLEESFIGENAGPEFALQLNVSKDEFNGMELESPEKDLKVEQDPTTVLKKALENIKEKEKGNVRKKRRSTNGGSDLDPEEDGVDTKKRKKKKKKKVESGADVSSDEELAVKTVRGGARGNTVRRVKAEE